jgi:predicted XRE-type DNA-binding protein
MGDLIQFPGNYSERLEKAGRHVRDTGEAYRLALTARNELVHEAVDQKYPQSKIATDLGISRPSVTRILGLPIVAPPPASDAA